MPAPKGNRFWEARSQHGRRALWDSPEQLWEACVEYFIWTEDNPLMAVDTVKFQGTGTLMEVPKMRAMTVRGLCVFLGMTEKTWREYAKKEDFSPVVTQVEAIIYQQKFAGAAAELLNPNIIARDLGLADRSEVAGPDGEPIQIETNDAARRVAAFLMKAVLDQSPPE